MSTPKDRSFFQIAEPGTPRGGYIPTKSIGTYMPPGNWLIEVVCHPEPALLFGGQRVTANRLNMTLRVGLVNPN
jgi:hypothetical protein